MSDPNGTIQRATDDVPSAARVPFIRTLAEAAEAFGATPGQSCQVRAGVAGCAR